MAALGALLLRRDTNRVRRAGIGRQTTKRTFAISLPAPGLFLGSARGTKRNSKTLEDEAKQRMPAGEDGPGSGIASDLPMPNSEAAFRRSSKLLRTPAGGAAVPRAEEVCFARHDTPLHSRHAMPMHTPCDADARPQ